MNNGLSHTQRILNEPALSQNVLSNTYKKSKQKPKIEDLKKKSSLDLIFLYKSDFQERRLAGLAVGYPATASVLAQP